MTNPVWTLIHPKATIDWLGLIPCFLDECDGRPAAQQFNTNYAHGGGWWPMDNWEYSAEDHSITYVSDGERDEALLPIASTKLRDEEVYIYPHAWVAIVQPNGVFEVSRMD